MSKSSLSAAIAVLLTVSVACVFAEDLALSSPGFPASHVAPNGAIKEPWGEIALSLIAPQGAPAPQQRCEDAPFPIAVTTTVAGPVALEQSAFRAPIWPGGVDVLVARVKNASEQPVDAVLELLTPQGMSLGERMGVLNGTAVLALPRDIDPDRQERDWGCTGGVTALPGWARPDRECDPAFKNIVAGMGGVPIIYRFAVKPGDRRTVVVGLCESHWSLPEKRPLLVYVEGAPRREIDPVGVWGQHVPGCLKFDAIDDNQDGKLEVVVEPNSKAQDKNTILNVV